MTMKNGSTFTGTINIIDNAEGDTAVSDNAVVAIENGCTRNLTGNCTLTSLTNNGTINFNGYTITLADGTEVSPLYPCCCIYSSMVRRKASP